MPPVTQDEALALARELVESSSATETEVTVESCEDRFVRFADTGPTQNADRERVDVSIRVRLAAEPGGSGGGFREARATCGSLDPLHTGPALERALMLARLSAPNPDLMPLGGAVSVPETAPQRPTMDHTFREKAAWVNAATEACSAEGLAPSGLIQTTALARTLVNSAGREVQGARTRASFSLTAGPFVAKPTGEGGPAGSGCAEAIASNVERIDAGRVIARAVDKAVRGRETHAIDAGEYTVVLEPAAVSSMLLFAAYCGFGAQEVHEKSSFLCGRIGERLFSPGLSIRDDAANEVYPGLPFDGEGAPKAPLTLLEDGCLRGPVTDARWASKLSRPNTGHGQPQPTTEGPAPSNLIVDAGQQSLEELIGGVKRGLLVSQFHYTNMIEPLDLTLTGMTRNGTFLIEDGKLSHAVRNLRFTETLVNALSRVTGIGAEREVAGALFEGEIVCPALRIERFRFTSTTDF
ncbi:MAG: PmbA protein [Chlamydiales bacterium]|jgi:PmbA protein